MEHADDPNAMFRGIIDSVQNFELATEADIAQIKAMGEQLLRTCMVVRRHITMYNLDCGAIQISAEITENPGAEPFVTASLDYYNYQNPEEPDVLEDDPVCSILLDPNESMPYGVDIPNNDSAEGMTDEVALAIATFSLEAAGIVSSELEQAFFEHMAAIGSFYFASTGELRVGYITYAGTNMRTVDAANAIAASDNRSYNIEKSRSIALSGTGRVHISNTIHLKSQDPPLEDVVTQSYLEISVLDNEERTYCVRISDTDDVFVPPLKSEDEFNEIEGLSDEDIETFYEAVGRDKLPKNAADAIVGALFEASLYTL